MTRPPFPFVVGCGRSGTTLLAAMLDSHPDLAVPGESGGIVLQFCHGLEVGSHPNRTEWPPVEEPGEPFAPSAIREMIDELARSHRYRAWGVDPQMVLGEAVSARASTRADVIRAAYAAYACRYGKRRYGDKTPGHVLHMARIAELFPEAVFVHVIRDGRDVALSMREMSWGPNDVAGCALHWAERVARGRQAGQILGPDRYLEVRYEELVSDTRAVLTRIADHVGVPFDRAMLHHGDGARRQMTMSPAPREDRNVERPPTTGLRDWRNQMDPVDAATFEAVAGRMLQDLGYTTGTAGSAAVAVGAHRGADALAAAARRPVETW